MTKQKVLIVEDDDAIATMYTMKLELSKFDVKRAANGHDGLGVSLYLDKLIMDQVGGDIDVRSVKGKGTTFTITRPTPKEVSVGSQVVTSN